MDNPIFPCSVERNVQILVALLKAHGIRRVIASPGTTHMCILGTLQADPSFQVWSAVDERHAAYMAVGMAAESGEPVVLTCTGATASRNYLPALTEAFYRQLPILAVTASKTVDHIGNMFSQLIDRSSPPADCVRCSVPCPPVENDRQAKACELALGKAILELTRDGGGPVHINLETFYSRDFRPRPLPQVRRLRRFAVGDELPPIPENARIALFIANHKPFSKKESDALEAFLAAHDAVAVCEATSQWYGSRRVVASLVCAQKGARFNPAFAHLIPDLVILIGNACNDYPLLDFFVGIAPVWYVHPDGEARDRFDTLEMVFEMPEAFFFGHYSAGRASSAFFDAWVAADSDLRRKIPDLPFSNLWIAQQTLPRIPESAVLHLGLSTTLQSWSAMLQTARVRTFSNVGACGIDGCVSTILGASLCNPARLYFGVVGDLAFFYDLNALGNRHVGPNIRLLLVNNGCGALFHAPGHVLEGFSDARSPFLDAAGHFAPGSRDLVRHFASDLGFRYLSASSKEEFLRALPDFLSAVSDRPVLFECFTHTADEARAWGARVSIATAPAALRNPVVGQMKRILPASLRSAIKGFLQ